MTVSRQITKNCHYISRFLTKPWEGEQRKLHYYDFDRDAFDSGPSLRLFAEQEINEQAVEEWLGRVVENPLAAIRPRLASADPKALDDWKFYRAAVLMLWLQGLRVETIDNEDTRRELSKVAAQSETEIDALVVAIRDAYDLRLVFTHLEATRFAPIFVPSTGIFKFTYPDDGCASGNAVGLGSHFSKNARLSSHRLTVTRRPICHGSQVRSRTAP